MYDTHKKSLNQFARLIDIDFDLIIWKKYSNRFRIYAVFNSLKFRKHK